MAVRRLLGIAGLLIGLAGLVLQFAVSIPAFTAAGHSLASAIVKYFSYFTILTNIALVLVYLADVLSASWLSWFRSPVTRGMMAAAMTLVMAFYHFVLAATWNPQGLFLACDLTLHYVTPILYLVWWVLAPHGTLAWSNIPVMVVPPVLYLAYAMIRGAMVAEYPYPVLEANRLGYAQVSVSIALLLIGFAVLCATVVTLDKSLPNRGTANA